MSIDTRNPDNRPDLFTGEVEPTRTRNAFSWLGDLADVVLTIMKPLSIPLLRVALGVVYVWFGILKIAGVSPIADLVAAMLPFLAHDTAVIGMGVVEVILGTALLIGVLVPWVAAAQVLHLLGTFLVFFVHPEVVHTGNPLLVTMEGEFIVKNLVLITGLMVVASYTRRRPE